MGGVEVQDSKCEVFKRRKTIWKCNFVLLVKSALMAGLFTASDSPKPDIHFSLTEIFTSRGSD